MKNLTLRLLPLAALLPFSAFAQETPTAAAPPATPPPAAAAPAPPAPPAAAPTETKAEASATTTASGGTATTLTVVTPAPASEDPEVAAAKKELARLTMERDRLMAENNIAKEKLAQELAGRRAELERQTLQAEEEKARLARELEAERIKSERELASLKLENEKLTIVASLAKNRAEIRLTELRLSEADARAEITKLTALMEQKDKEISASFYAESAPVYAADPFQDGVLTISDRRIPLNGPIVMKTADDIAERLDYFNNKDCKNPVFIVIDNSPGGSVMAGYKILKAMEGSKAPVYVVLKSFAASMAACITTLADRSFAYPNAVILHHQLSSMSFGNLTEQREGLKETEEWWRRLAGPISTKMGISSDQFIKEMYARVSTGDWTEFADKALELKWVDHVVSDIRETGLLKHPDALAKPVLSPPLSIPFLPRTTEAAFDPNALVERIDEKGRPFLLLPRANPKDVYYLYNPDNYYRIP